MAATSIYDHQQAFISYLSGYISDRKRQLIHQVLQQRTRHLTVVLENIRKSHNASAVVRSCDCFGVQDIHIIEQENIFDVHPHIASGALQWITHHHYNDEGKNNTEACFHILKNQGYQIAVTAIAQDGIDFRQLELNQKTAILFGTEYAGASDWAIAHADKIIEIPMMGFTDSLNLSVSAGIVLQYFRSKLEESDVDWALDEEEQNSLMMDWYMSSVRNVDMHARNFIASLEA